jgi:hypothetical protein
MLPINRERVEHRRHTSEWLAHRRRLQSGHQNQLACDRYRGKMASFTKKAKIRKPKPYSEILELTTDEGRLRAVSANYEWIREFYQREVNLYAYTYIVLTIITLIGTAMTPLLLLFFNSQMPRAPFWEAIPSAVGGLAAAINIAFRYRENWTQSYYTLSAIDNEYCKFTARTSPDYSASKSISESIDNLQAKISSFTMSEVESWRAVMLKSEPIVATTPETASAPQLKISLTPAQLGPSTDGSGSIVISKPAPPEGVTVVLASEGKVALNEKTLFLKSGDTKANFSFKVGAAAPGDRAMIKATANGVTAASELTIMGGSRDLSPRESQSLSTGRLSIAKFTIVPDQTRAGDEVTASVELAGAAPTGETVVVLNGKWKRGDVESMFLDSFKIIVKQGDTGASCQITIPTNLQPGDKLRFVASSGQDSTSANATVI